MIFSTLYFALLRTAHQLEQLQLNVYIQIASISLNFLLAQSVLRFPIDVYGFMCYSLISFGQKYTLLLRRFLVQSNSDVEYLFFSIYSNTWSYLITSIINNNYTRHVEHACSGVCNTECVNISFILKKNKHYILVGRCKKNKN